MTPTNTTDLVREFFPDATDEFASYVIWNHTPFPFGGWKRLRHCVKRYRNAMRSINGRSLCLFCSWITPKGEDECRRCAEALRVQP